jgi:molybdopterin/thiamine biosynthesis adenylyltransferase
MMSSRSHTFYHPGVMPNPPIHIVGCGGIGSWTALALAKMGLNKLRLWDDDVVEEENIGCQAYGRDNVLEHKVVALAQLILQQTVGEVEIRTATERVTKATELNGIVIAAVDSMASRKMIFENCKKRSEVSLMIDGRIGGELIKVYTLTPHNPRHQRFWDIMWHSDRNSSRLPCTGRQVVYVGLTIGAFIAEAVARYLRDGMLCKEIIYHAGDRRVVWKEENESTSTDSESDSPYSEHMGER